MKERKTTTAKKARKRKVSARQGKVSEVAKVQQKIADESNLPLTERIWQQLRLCYDPEIPINIVELGLIYGVDVKEEADGTQSVLIRMTLTNPMCTMGPFIAEEARQRVLTLPGVSKVDIEFTFDPPWDQSRMSMQAKLELGMV